MSSSETPSYIAYWGAALSTLLALVKLWELWRDRFRIDISYNFSSEPSIGNKILIRNLSNKPILLEYWEVLYCSGRWPRRKFQEIVFPEHDASDIRIDAHSTYTLTFCEENYFSLSSKVLKGKKIYIRIYVAGRKKILKLVYP